MPAILVASKMKSGLPKPVHSAAPILHVPTARTIPQPCYLKFGSKVEVTKPLYSSQIPLKSSNGQENAGDGLPARKSSSVENGFDTQQQWLQVALSSLSQLEGVPNCLYFTYPITNIDPFLLYCPFGNDHRGIIRKCPSSAPVAQVCGALEYL
ncbi:hypothetical protein BTVI_68980 [Pitangus sulphuratus]|nr:hypothetical protein BTVI_68980 [Pitangus sulphuratus]